MGLKIGDRVSYNGKKGTVSAIKDKTFYIRYDDGQTTYCSVKKEIKKISEKHIPLKRLYVLVRNDEAALYSTKMYATPDDAKNEVLKANVDPIVCQLVPISRLDIVVETKDY